MFFILIAFGTGREIGLDFVLIFRRGIDFIDDRTVTVSILIHDSKEWMKY